MNIKKYFSVFVIGVINSMDYEAELSFETHPFDNNL